MKKFFNLIYIYMLTSRVINWADKTIYVFGQREFTIDFKVSFLLSLL